MKRNIIAVICLMLAATFVFASCTKKKYKYYVDNDGNTHIAYTRSDGEFVTDGYGGIVIVQTEKNGNPILDKYGKPETEVFQMGISIDSSGKKIDAVTYSLTLPDNWVVRDDMTESSHLRYGDKDSRTGIDIFMSKEELSEVVKSAEELIDDAKEKVSNVVDDKKETVTLKDGEITDVTKITFSYSTEKDGKTAFVGSYFYIFRVKNVTYTVSCGSENEKEFKNTDFEEVINAINFK